MTYCFEQLPSTQRWLLHKLAQKEVEVPCAVLAQWQTDGIGSRNNRWIGQKGNFFASVAMAQSDLPEDLPLGATSIYMAMVMKGVLAAMGSKVWVKWPNDFYLQDRKIGGCITTKKGEIIVAGIGLNLVDAPENFGILDLSTTPETILERFVEALQKTPSWKQIFSIFSLEFKKCKAYGTHDGDRWIPLSEATLQEDGSLIIGKRRVTSLR